MFQSGVTKCLFGELLSFTVLSTSTRVAKPVVRSRAFFHWVLQTHVACRESGTPPNFAQTEKEKNRQRKRQNWQCLRIPDLRLPSLGNLARPCSVCEESGAASSTPDVPLSPPRRGGASIDHEGPRKNRGDSLVQLNRLVPIRPI